MKIKILLTTLLIYLLVFNSRSQGICNDIITSAGNFENGASGSISWTLGEPVSETVTSANNSVTQGFHQTFCCPIITAIETSEINNLLVYPNPASQKVTINFGKSLTGQYKITLTDLQGRILIADKFYCDREASAYRLNLSQYTEGIYLLNIHNIETGTKNIYRINKIN